MIAATQTVREIAQTKPSSISVFEQFGIEYCCGGGKPLGEACAAKELDVEMVIAALEVASRHDDAHTEGWTKESLASLMQHIVRTHHAYCKEELPLLSGLAAKVVNRHGGTHPELVLIQSKLAQLADELTDHLVEEEVVVFPMIVTLEAEMASEEVRNAESPSAIGNSLELLMAEHDTVGTLLADVRGLSCNFVPPEDACTTYQAFFDGLREFERDIHRHVHLENNILFPRAIEIATSPLAA